MVGMSEKTRSTKPESVRKFKYVHALPDEKLKFHREKAKINAKKYKILKNNKQNMCKGTVYCKETNLFGNTSLCQKHWFGQQAKYLTYLDRKNNIPTESTAKVQQNLAELWLEQEGKCAITNTQLIAGSNCAIDHIIPISKGGTSVKSNLRFVNMYINMFKFDLTEDEFKCMLKQMLPGLTEWISTNSNLVQPLQQTEIKLSVN